MTNCKNSWHTCGIFQLYFYKNLFDPLPDSQIIHDEKLTETTISSFLDDIFAQSTEESKTKINEFAAEYNMRISWSIKPCQNSNILDLFNIADFGQFLIFLLFFRLMRNELW